MLLTSQLNIDSRLFLDQLPVEQLFLLHLLHLFDQVVLLAMQRMELDEVHELTVIIRDRKLGGMHELNRHE